MGDAARSGAARRALALLALAAPAAAGPEVPAPADPRLAALPPVIGEPRNELVVEDDTVLDVAYRHRLGFDRVARANAQVPVWIPEPGTIVRLPTQHVLPEPPWTGLVINVPEMQLYDFTVSGPPEVFAIAIGDEMDPSLIGTFAVGAKRVNPAWHVPKSILAEKPELPAVVAPGPDNPLGPYWMTIGSTSYGIHGTNNEWSIGREATHGCIRLYNDEIERLFARVKPRTPLRLAYQSVKLGQRGSTVYVEAHPDLYRREPDALELALEKARALGLASELAERALRRAVAEARGIPVPIATLPPLATASH